MKKNVPGYMSLAILVLALISIPEGSAFAIENDPNLVGFWQFEGDVNDAAGTNHGTLTGDPTWVEDPNRGWCLS
ncbi:MAG: hypothetical protein ACYS3S_18520, partial [Planctomycetota bacterium]